MTVKLIVNTLMTNHLRCVPNQNVKTTISNVGMDNVSMNGNKCDGIDNCGDGSDEMKCNTATHTKYSTETYQCKGSIKCIKMDHVCDKRKDCPFDDDEDPNVVLMSVSRITGTVPTVALIQKLVLNASVQKDTNWIRVGKNVLISMNVTYSDIVAKVV